MIPLNQQDYIKYCGAFRADAYQGATVVRSLVENPAIVDTVVTTQAACAAIFTDAHRSTVDGMAADVLAEQQDKYDIAVQTWLSSMDRSNKLPGGIPQVTADFLAFERDQNCANVLERSKAYLDTAILRTENFSALCQRSNYDVLCRPIMASNYDRARVLNNDHNIKAAVDVYFAANLTSSFAGIQTYYPMLYAQSINCVLVGACLYTSSGAGYRQPVCFVYNVDTATVTQHILAHSVSSSQTTAVNGQCIPAFDESLNRLYFVYMTSDSSYFCRLVARIGILTAATFTQETVLYIAQTSYNNTDAQGLYGAIAAAGKCEVAYTMDNYGVITCYTLDGIKTGGARTLIARGSSYTYNTPAYRSLLSMDAPVSAVCQTQTSGSGATGAYYTVGVVYPDFTTGTMKATSQYLGYISGGTTWFVGQISRPQQADAGIFSFYMQCSSKDSNNIYTYTYRHFVVLRDTLVDLGYFSGPMPIDIQADPFLGRAYYTWQGVTYMYDYETSSVTQVPGAPAYTMQTNDRMFAWTQKNCRHLFTKDNHSLVGKISVLP